MGLRRKDFCFFIISGGISVLCLLSLALYVGFLHEKEKFKHFIITLVLVIIAVLFILEPIYFLAVSLNHIGTPKRQRQKNAFKGDSAQEVPEEPDEQKQPERRAGGKDSSKGYKNKQLTRIEYLQHVIQSLKSQIYIEEEHRHESQNLRYQHVASEMLLLLGYFIALLILVVGSQSELSYYDTRITYEIMVPPTHTWLGVQELDVLEDVYKFLEFSIISTFQTNRKGQEAANDSLREVGWFHGDVSRLLGVVRLHQVRYANKHVGRLEPKFLDQNFMPGWKLPYKHHLYEEQHWRIFEPWKPKSSSEHSWTLSNWQSGEILDYPTARGYVALLARNKQNSMVILDYLREKKWLDGQTAVVSIDFTLYNVDANMFTVITVMAEQTLFGRLVSQTDIRSCKLLMSLDELTFTGLLLLILYLMMFVKFCCALVATAWYHKRFLSSIWHVMDCLIVLLNILLIFGFRQRESIVLNMVNDLEKAQKTEFVDFRVPARIDKMITGLAGILVSVTSLSLWRTLHFDVSFALFTHALWRAATPLITITFVTIVLIFGFSINANVINGNDSRSFVRLLKSFVSTLSMPMRFNADVDPNDLDYGGDLLGFLLYATLMITVSIFLTNIFITLVCDYTVNARIELQKQELAKKKVNLSYFQFLYMEYFHQFRPILDALNERLRQYFSRKRSKRTTVAEEVEAGLKKLEQDRNLDIILKLRYVQINSMDDLVAFLEEQKERDKRNLEKINMKGVVIMAQFELLSKELLRLNISFKKIKGNENESNMNLK